MKEDGNPKGVMNSCYGIERIRKPELIFRYRVRARMVAYAAEKYFNSLDSLRILDFGAADGLTLLELNALFHDGAFLGIEYSEELIQAAPDLPSNINIVNGDVTHLPHEIPDCSWDLVSALAVLEHLSNPLEAIKEAYRMLRPGGIFVATCPHPFWENISTRLGTLNDDYHELEMTKNTMISIVKQAGLSLLDYKKFMWAPIAFLPYLRIDVSPDFSLACDKLIDRMKFLNFFFVNQCLIAEKQE